MKKNELVKRDEKERLTDIEVILGIRDNYADDAKQYAAYLLERDLSHCPDSVEAYLNELSKNVAAATYNKRLAMIKKRMRTMFDEKYKGNNVEGKFQLEGFLSRLKPSKIATTEVDERKILSAEEFEKFLNYDEMQEPIRFIARFMWATGCRISESLDIRLKNVKIFDDKAFIKIMGKGRKERTVKIKEEFYDELREYFQGKVYLFEKPNHKKFRREYVSMRLLLDARECLKRDVSSHTLRHSFATRIYKAHPEALPGLSRYLGHSKTSITADLYVHTSLDDEMLGLDK